MANVRSGAESMTLLCRINQLLTDSLDIVELTTVRSTESVRLLTMGNSNCNDSNRSSITEQSNETNNYVTDKTNKMNQATRKQIKTKFN